MEKERPITPVLLGADLCAYSVARAFHEYSGVKSYAFGRYRCGLTQFSKIIKAYVCAGLDDMRIAGPALFDFAREHMSERLFVIPCSDLYVETAALISENFPDYYSSYLPRHELRFKLRNKSSFYALLEKYGVPYPESFDVTYTNRKKEIIKAVSYPVVVKPADSAEYWKYCSFPGMKKVYFPKDSYDAVNICEKIYEGGYRGRIVLQKRIMNPKLSVLTVFFQDGRAVRAAYGRVILEETGATSHGNHAAIITAPTTPLCKSLMNTFEHIGYSGFANFDIISDGKEEFVLEVNLRQGRSCDYMRAAGINIAELITKTANGEKIEKSLECGKVYWHYPPHSAVRLLAENSDTREAEALMKSGFAHSPLSYFPDTKNSKLRRAYVAIHARRLEKSFMKNAGNEY